MPSQFLISEEVLAYALDLPEGARLGAVQRIPTPDGKYVYELKVDVEGWPEGSVELHYTRYADGSFGLTGVSPRE